PCLVVAINPDGQDYSVTTDTLELSKNGQTMFSGLDVMQQPNAQNAIHGVVTQVNGECRRLESIDPRHYRRWLNGLGSREHVGGIVGGENYPVGLFTQQRPEAAGPTG